MTDTPPLPPRDGPKSASDVRLRIFASIGMIAIATAALWFGELAFWVLVSVISLFMMAEWADLHKVDAQQKRLSMFAISVPLAILSPLAAGPGFFARMSGCGLSINCRASGGRPPSAYCSLKR